MTYLERLFIALYLSEGWYVWYSEGYLPQRRRLHAKTLAVVLFDRVLNEECLNGRRAAAHRM